MSVSLIIWGQRPDLDADTIFGDILSKFNQIHRADNYEQVISTLQRNLDARMILYFGESTIADMVPAIQTIHRRFPKVSFVALPKYSNATQSEEAARLDSGLERQNLPGHHSRDSHWVDNSEKLRNNFTHTDEHPCVHNLTPRQKDVLILITNGKSNKEIARQLGMTEGTVKIHCMAIFRALHVTNRTQAAMVAKQYPQQCNSTPNTAYQYM